MSSDISTASGRVKKSIASKIASLRYSYLFFSFVVPIAILYAAYAAFGIHPFGEHSILALDLNGQYVYYFEALRNILNGDAELLYSFSRAMGGEFMGIYTYYLASPLSFLTLLFPADKIVESLFFLILLRAGLCGASFGFYLHHASKEINKYIIISFSVLYSLSSYAVIYGGNVMWMDALILLPIITYAIERLIKFGKYKLFVISLSLSIISNFYMGYMICIYVAIYFFFYYLSQSKENRNPLSKSKHFSRSFLRIILFSGISVLISAAVIVSAYYSLSFGKTTFSEPSFKLSTNFGFFEFLTKLLPASYDNVSNGLPLVYGGIFTLILLPVYFTGKKIALREKYLSACFIVFFILSFWLNPLNLIWHGFQAPNWLNYRYSFMLVFFMLVLAYKGLEKAEKRAIYTIAGSAAFVVLFAIIFRLKKFESYTENGGRIPKETVIISVISAISLALLLYLFIAFKKGKTRALISFMIATVVCIEAFCSSFISLNLYHEDVTFSKHSSYEDFVDGLRPTVSQLKEFDNGFYRFEKTAHRKYNDNLALGIRGLSNSTSTLNASSIEFLQSLGYASHSHWSVYLGGNPVSDSLLGIKYIINEGRSENLDKYYSEAFSSGKYTVYQNTYTMPLAYVVDDGINELSLDIYDVCFEASNALLGAMIGGNTADVFVPIKINDFTTDNCKFNTGYDDGYVKYASNKANGTLNFEFTAPTGDEIFMHIPTKYQRECKLTVNNKDAGSVFAKETRRAISLGSFEKGEKVTVSISINNEYDNIFFIPQDTYFYYLDRSAFEGVFQKLIATPKLEISEGFTDTHLKGTIKTLSSDQTMLTTIPYDEGWQIYIDGSKAKYYKTLDTFIALNIKEAGEHSVELIYRPHAVSKGIALSLLGIAVFTAICVTDSIIKKKKNSDNIHGGR